MQFIQITNIHKFISIRHRKKTTKTIMWQFFIQMDSNNIIKPQFPILKFNMDEKKINCSNICNKVTSVNEFFIYTLYMYFILFCPNTEYDSNSYLFQLKIIFKINFFNVLLMQTSVVFQKLKYICCFHFMI